MHIKETQTNNNDDNHYAAKCHQRALGKEKTLFIEFLGFWYPHFTDNETEPWRA